MNFVILWPVLSSILWPSSVTTVPFTVDRAIVEQKKAGKSPEGVRWDDHLSLHFGKGTHVELRGRFQGDLRESDALLDAVEDSSGLHACRLDGVHRRRDPTRSVRGSQSGVRFAAGPKLRPKN